MTHLVAGALAMATVALLLGIYLSRPAPSAALVGTPTNLSTVAAKADRLPLPVMQVFVGGSSGDPTSDVSNPRASEPYSGGNATANVGQRDRKVTDGARGTGSDERPSTAADMTSRERPAHTDPVCGPRGRTWYTRENGWKYWRCQR